MMKKPLLFSLLLAGCVGESPSDESEDSLCLNCPPIGPSTDTTIAVPTLAPFTPSAVNNQGTVDVYALSSSGLALRRLNAATNTWRGAWVQLGAPVTGLAPQGLSQYNPGSGYDWLLPGVARPSQPSSDLVFYGFRNQNTDYAGRSQSAWQSSGIGGRWTLTSSQERLPFASSSANIQTLPDHIFSPASPLVVNGEAHIFGSGYIHGEAETAAAIYTHDVIVDRIENLSTGTVHWSQLAPSVGDSVAVGAGSAAVRNHNAHIFYTSGPTLDTHGEVFYGNVRSYRLEAQWNGADMGNPTGSAGDTVIVGAPLTSSWTDGSHGDHINLFVVAFNRQDHRFHLYQRAIGACSEDIWLSCWDNWQDFGSPPGLNGRKFRMTTAAVRYPAGGGVLIDLFGYTEHTQVGNDSSSGPQQLVHYSWDGGGWGWEPTQSAPDNGDVRITSSMAVGQRVGAYLRSSTGRIWEFAILPSGATQWTDLSIVQPFTIIGP